MVGGKLYIFSALNLGIAKIIFCIITQLVPESAGNLLILLFLI